MKSLLAPRTVRVLPAVVVLGTLATLAVGRADRTATRAEVAAAREVLFRTAMDGDASPIADALSAVDEDVRIYDIHLSTLANPWMEGRVPGSPGMELAKDYIEYHFRAYGLEAPFPAEGSGENGSGLGYRHQFELRGTMEVTEAGLAALAGGRAMQFEAGTDFNVMGIGGSGAATGGVTFVGYGIDNGPNDWSSFAADTDLTGEIALMLRFEPMDEEGNSRWADRGWSRRAGFGNKLRGVLERGAAGVIIVSPPGANDPRAGELIEPGGGGSGMGSVPVVMMSPEAADRMLAASGGDGSPTITSLRPMADEGGAVMRLDAVASLNAMMERTPMLGENVGGLLRGRGELADEYIVIGGHLDHLGMGYFGSRSGAGQLHPGADDNASGSAGILLMAQRMSERWEDLGDTPRRSILFMCFDGEESGLIGSRAYVDDPIAPVEAHKLMMNFDMIGRITGGRVSVSGANTAEGFGEWLEPYFQRTPLTVVQPERMSGASDHTSFYRRNIPVLFAIIADFHDDYHTPADTAWKINRVGATHASRLFMDIAMDYAMVPEALPFAGSSPSPRRGQAEASTPADSASPAAGGGDAPTRASIRVRFGIRPGDYIEGQDGIPVDAVTEGSSAALAGVVAGDRLVRWDGQKLTSVQDWMVLLARHAPGDTVRIGVIRDGEEMSLEVTLQGRDG